MKRNELVSAILAVSLSWAATLAVNAQSVEWRARHDAGVAAANAGDYFEAEKLLEEAVPLATKETDQLCLAKTLRNLGGVYNHLGKYAQAEVSLNQAVAILHNTVGDQDVEMAKALNNLANAYERQGNYEEAAIDLKQALQIATAKARPGDLSTVPEIDNLVECYRACGKYEEARSYLELARKQFVNGAQEKSQLFAVTLFHEAELDRLQGNFAQAEQNYKAALKAAEVSLGAQNPLYATFLEGLAQLYAREGASEKNYRDAEELLYTAQKIIEHSFGLNSAENALILHELIFAYIEQGKYQQAEPLAIQEKNIWENKFGLDNIRVTLSMIDLGEIYKQEGRYGEAEAKLTAAKSIAEKQSEPDYLSSEQILNWLGVLYQQEGKRTQAEQTLEEALNICLKKLKLSPQHADVSQIQHSLATVYASEGKFDDAQSLFEQSLKTTRASLGENSAQYATELGEAAAFYKLKGDFSKAEPMFQQNISIDERLFGPQSARLAADLQSFADFYVATKQPDKARQLQEQAEKIKRSLKGSASVEDAANVSNSAQNDLKKSSPPVTDKWALVVGISRFKDPTINLKYAAKDAVDFSGFLVSDEHFQKSHITLLVDENATRQQIVAKLGDLGTLANKDDLVVIYVSTHGSSSVHVEGSAVNFLVPHDADIKNLLANGIAMQWLTDMIKESIHSDRVVLIMDVCHSAAAAPTSIATASLSQESGGESESKGLSRKVDTSNACNVVPLGAGQVVLCASLADQISWESKEYPNGVFTRRLIEALKTNGDRTTLSEAFNVLKDKVETEVLHDRYAFQTPLLDCKRWTGGDPVLGVVPSKPRSHSALLLSSPQIRTTFVHTRQSN